MLQKDPGVERVVRFMGFLASQLPDERKEEALIFCEELLGWLLGLAPAKDKTVRARACQLLREIISGLPQDAGLDEARFCLRIHSGTMCGCSCMRTVPQICPNTYTDSPSHAQHLQSIMKDRRRKT